MVAVSLTFTNPIHAPCRVRTHSLPISDKVYLDTVPSVRRCGWINFKNRFQSASGGREHAIDVLNTSADLEEQMDQEHLRRMAPEKQEAYRAGWRKPAQRRHAGTSTSELPFERIRINSSIVLSYLADVSDNQSWPMQPHTFLLPFAFLIHHHQAMNDKLDRLREDRLREDRLREEFGTPEPTAAPPAGNLMPHYNRFNDASYEKPKKVRFDDLWSLFRYGELVCYPNNPDGGSERKAGRVRSEQGGDAPKQPAGNVAPRPPTAAIAPDSLRSAEGDCTMITAFYLDHDGTKYGTAQISISIQYFRGEMEIQRLPIFPVRFLKNKDALFGQLRERGEKFKRLLEKSHGGREMLVHNGWSLTRTPLGAPVLQTPWEGEALVPWRRVLQSEYLDTEIIIDFKEALQSRPSWSPDFTVFDKESIIPDVMYDSCTIHCWEDERRSGKPRQAREILVTCANVDIDLWNKLAKADPFIHDPWGDRDHTIVGDEQKFSEEDLILLPARVMAYSLRDRKFFHADTMTAEAVSQTHKKPLFLITRGDLGVTPDMVEGRLKDIFRLANRWNCILLPDEAEIFLSQRTKGDGSIQRNAMVSIFLRILEYYPGILFLTTNRVGVMDEAVKSRVHVSLHYPDLGRDETLQLFEMNIKRLKKIEKSRAGDRNKRAGDGDGDWRDESHGGPVAEMDVRADEIMAFANKHYDRGSTVRWNGRQIRNAFQIAASLAHNRRRERARRDKERRALCAKKGGNDGDYDLREDDDDDDDNDGDYRRERRDYQRRRDDGYSRSPRRSGRGGNARDRDRDRGGDPGSRKQRARSRSGSGSGSRSRSRGAGTQRQQRKAGKSSGGAGAPAADDAGGKSRDRSRARGGGGDSETARRRRGEDGRRRGADGEGERQFGDESERRRR
ncbi:hypothetical protein RB594_002317 [Gaeumannomyces avenae]